MQRPYELGLVVRMDPNQQVIDETIERVQEWIKEEDYGKTKRMDRWGQRRLAYEIDGQRDGYYIFLYIDIDPLGLPELEENMKLETNILRYLIVREDEQPETTTVTEES